jgi:hypothetical protein
MGVGLTNRVARNQGVVEMKIEKIQAEKVRAMTKYDIAAKIREILDEARKSYGPAKWEEDDVESEIIALVTEE